MKRFGAALVLGGLSALLGACALDSQTGGEPDSETTGTERAELYGGGTWTAWHPSAVPICFDTPGFSDMRRKVQEIVEDTWARSTQLRFIGWTAPYPVHEPAWTDCGSSDAPQQITISFTTSGNGFTDHYGRSSSHATHVQLNRTNAADQFRYSVIHELGHALSFAHEQERPDNWGGDFIGGYIPIFCDKVDQGRTFLSGGTKWTIYDTNSIMNYCSIDPVTGGNPTELSGLDVFGAQKEYGWPIATTCQFMSDNYGIVANQTFGFAPTGVQTKWSNMSCQTVPSSNDSCQKASDLYGIEANVTFGIAPSNVRTWWTNKGCQTKPRDSRTLCQRATSDYNIQPNQSMGTAPTETQNWWSDQGCSTLPVRQSTCQHMSDLYGITANVDFGWAQTEASTYYAVANCFTVPRTERCQLLSDNYGLSPTDHQGAAPQAARDFYVNHGCTTSPKSTNNCQRASDLYQIRANIGFGYAPPEVRTWWGAHSCNTQPSSADFCQEVADRYGIARDGYATPSGVSVPTWGAAPSDVQTWWSANGCQTRAKVANPLPG